MQKKRLFSNPNRKKLIIDNRVYTKNFTGPKNQAAGNAKKHKLTPEEKFKRDMQICQDAGVSNLHCAILLSAGVDKIKELIASGADVNKYSFPFRTPLLAATAGGCLNYPEDIDKEKYSKEFTEETIVKCSSDINVVKLLLEAGADPKTRICEYSNDNDNNNIIKCAEPLRFAVNINRADIVKLLLNAGASVNTPYYTEIHLERDNNLPYKFNIETTLSAAIRNGNVDIVKLLLDAGAKPYAPIFLYSKDTYHEFYTPFYSANDTMMEELFKYYNATEFEKQVELCLGPKPTEDDVYWLAIALAEFSKHNLEEWKRTKNYADTINRITAMLNFNGLIYSENRRKNCIHRIIRFHDDAEKLKHIYDYCEGDVAALSGSVCQSLFSIYLE